MLDHPNCTELLKYLEDIGLGPIKVGHIFKLVNKITDDEYQHAPVERKEGIGILGATNGIVMMALPGYLKDKSITEITLERYLKDGRWRVKVYHEEENKK